MRETIAGSEHQLTTTMTPEEQRIAIAEACGWIALKHDPELARKIHRFPPTNWVGISPVVQTMEHGKDESKDFNYWIVPNYCFDLNATNEAEKALKAMPHDGGIFTPWERYARTLVSELGTLDAIRATAAQRSEVFLRTIGKWKD